MMIADNLLSCNRFFKALKKRWVAAGMNEQAMSVRVAKRFCRIAYQMAAGGQVFRHPSCREAPRHPPQAVDLSRRARGSSMAQVMTDLQVATDHIPKSEHAPEAKSLYEELQPRRWKSGVSASFLPKKMNRHRITRPKRCAEIRCQFTILARKDEPTPDFPVHLLVTGSAITLDVSRLQSSF